MHQPPTDDELIDLALEDFRNPPQSYYDWVDAVLAHRRDREAHNDPKSDFVRPALANVESQGDQPQSPTS
jgi:hypothetical protein